MNRADRFFVDTNVLLYSVDASAPRKREAAREWLDTLWQRGAGRLSWQVVNEFSANAERKIGVGRTTARATARVWAEWQPVGHSLALLERAWHWMDEAQVAYWGSLIVAAAEQAGCGWLLSEDFQAGQRFGPVTVVNPFVQNPGDFQGLGRRG